MTVWLASPILTALTTLLLTLHAGHLARSLWIATVGRVVWFRQQSLNSHPGVEGCDHQPVGTIVSTQGNAAPVTRKPLTVVAGDPLRGNLELLDRLRAWRVPKHGNLAFGIVPTK